MSLVQTANTVSGTFLLGGLTFTPFTASIQSDGSIAFTASGTQGSAISLDVMWRLAMPDPARITGSHTQLWRATVLSGDMRIESDILDALRK